jgi:hypothetical protein
MGQVKSVNRMLEKSLRVYGKVSERRNNIMNQTILVSIAIFSHGRGQNSAIISYHTTNNSVV